MTPNHLFTALASTRQRLENYIDAVEKQKNNFSPIPALVTSSTLQQLCYLFQLSNFERDLLLLCTGMEIYPDWGELCAAAQANAKLNYPTFSLALTIFPEPHWSAITSLAPLRRWGLIDIDDSNILTAAPLRINERVLHFLMGVEHLDEQIQPILEPITSTKYNGVSNEINQILVDSHLQIVQNITDTWEKKSSLILPIIQLCGNEATSKLSIATVVCEQRGLKLYSISVQNLPHNINDFHQLLRLWELEASLTKSVLFLNCHEINTGDSAQLNTIKSFVELVKSPLILSILDKLSITNRTVINFDVHKPTHEEQKSLWQKHLNNYTELDNRVEALVSQFNLTAPEINNICIKSLAQKPTYSIIWNNCREQVRPKLDDLVQRITPFATWDDIVLPEAQIMTLKAIAAQVRQCAKVYQEWGFASKGGRGLGISALFSGVSGTGKTMSAEVLAQELQLDLYRIDLSAVVSKYIGETEKNLRSVFDAAETGGTILLFDEADALFGKRSDVKDSHDRYANMEVSYLLQRMEEYRGLAILTTNLKDSIDTAFMRRIRFVVKYSFPDIKGREEIWRRVFPKNTPTENLDFAKLAKLNVAGGNIRNIALNAAFMAADASEPVGMKHIKGAAYSEYMKLERQLTDAEVRGWE
ncbi:MAG: AAA family ATPase [Scytonematopsis contorta HA4267-MV1]|jgi:AAA+ superfamily predicted ATPase|nr:AAA family ATPase [Scytonematopsis contorta HA4267-MV1]